MKWVIEQIKAEPVAVQAIIQSLLGVFLSFGMRINTDQMATILVFTSTILAFITRKNVTPNVRLTGTGAGETLGIKQPKPETPGTGDGK